MRCKTSVTFIKLLSLSALKNTPALFNKNIDNNIRPSLNGYQENA
jgi:hypothetical protein